MQRAPLFAADSSSPGCSVPGRTQSTCSYSAQGQLRCPEGYMNYHQASRSMGTPADEAFAALQKNKCQCKKQCTPSVQSSSCVRCISDCQRK